jgi:hypothetical protein
MIGEHENKKFEELAALLSVIDDGEPTAETYARLNEVLTGDPETCEFYLDYMALTAHLDQEFGGVLPVGIGDDERPEMVLARTTHMILQKDRRVAATILNNRWWMGAAASIMLSASVTGWVLFAKSRSGETGVPADGGDGKVEMGVAVLTRTLDAEFGVKGMHPEAGDLLGKGELRLDYGVAQIEFYNGARVMLEAPARLEFLGQDECFLRKGRLRAVVPPQSGSLFVHTPAITVQGSGSELGIFITPSGTTEIHNFEGRVRISAVNAPASRSGVDDPVLPGLGVLVSSDGDLGPLAADPKSFLSWVDIVETSRANARRRYRDWRSEVAEVRTDPRVIGFYSFEDAPSGARVLADETESGGAHDGAIVGCQWTTGRWTGKGALEFKRPSDRVRVQLDRRSDSMSWMAWVRLDAMDGQPNALVHTEGEAAGAPQWLLTPEGKLQLAIHVGAGPKDWVSYVSPVVFDKDRPGKWRQLVTVYDAKNGFVIHYSDGAEVSRHPITKETALVIGTMQLGNCGQAEIVAENATRHLKGRMDEMVLFNEALSEGEIRSFYEKGKPEA